MHTKFFVIRKVAETKTKNYAAKVGLRAAVKRVVAVTRPSNPMPHGQRGEGTSAGSNQSSKTCNPTRHGSGIKCRDEIQGNFEAAACCSLLRMYMVSEYGVSTFIRAHLVRAGIVVAWASLGLVAAGVTVQAPGLV